DAGIDLRHQLGGVADALRRARHDDVAAHCVTDFHLLALHWYAVCRAVILSWAECDGTTRNLHNRLGIRIRQVASITVRTIANRGFRLHGGAQHAASNDA